MASSFTPLLSTPSPRPPPYAAHPSSFLQHHPSFLLLSRCASRADLLAVLPHILKSGLYSEEIFQTKLVALFAKSGSLAEAYRVFDSVPDKPNELYDTILKAHAATSSLPDTLSFFCRMKDEGVHHVVYNFTYILKLCGSLLDLRRGQEVHAQLLTNGCSSNLQALTALMNFYAKCGLPGDARKVFDRLPQKDTIAWNAMITAYMQNDMPEEAMAMARMMGECGESPDPVTLIATLPSCGDLRLLKLGKSVHAYCLKAGFENIENISNTLICMYAKCRAIKLARLVFDRTMVRDVVSWNSIINGYIENGDAEEAIVLFRRMLSERMNVTEVTLMAALDAASDLGDVDEGMRIHDLILREGLNSDVNVMNSLITMYSKCRRPDTAAEIFRNLPEKTLVSWNAIIAGFAMNNRPSDALGHFREMHLWNKSVTLDSFSLTGVISAIADVSVPRLAKWIHGYGVRLHLDRNSFVFTALVDMYVKCGSIQMARKLFDSRDWKDITAWNAMIDGYGVHGMGRDAIELFENMKSSPSVRPDGVSFLCILSACSHSGLVEEGKMYFASMKLEYGLEPWLNHYSCMVDLLGRAGLLQEAWDFIQEMPIEPGISIFGAMLGACKIHKNIDLAEKAAERLFKLEPTEGGYHVLLSNIYAASSMWDDSARVRRMMEEKGLQKTAGYTFIELKNRIHTFCSGSTDHPQSKRIYERLEELFEEIKAVGYVPDTHSIHDVEDEVKEQLLNTHSEKLAISFGLISTSPGTAIQIRKNLRVCGDCHNATKYISLVTGREIIVRDMHRFHHFKNGACSCGDYW